MSSARQHREKSEQLLAQAKQEPDPYKKARLLQEAQDFLTLAKMAAHRESANLPSRDPWEPQPQTSATST